MGSIAAWRAVRLGLVGVVVLVPIGCSDAADGLVDRAIGRWACAPDDEDPQPTPFDVVIERGAFRVPGMGRGTPDLEGTWELDGTEVQLTSPRGTPGWRIVGVEDDDGRATVGKAHEQARYDVEVVTDDEVTFQGRSEDADRWTCRRT